MGSIVTVLVKSRECKKKKENKKQGGGRERKKREVRRKC